MTRPSKGAVVFAFAAAAASMGAALYFAGQDQMPIALLGTLLFVMLGGVGFELARRRSA